MTAEAPKAAADGMTAEVPEAAAVAMTAGVPKMGRPACHYLGKRRTPAPGEAVSMSQSRHRRPADGRGRIG